LTAGDGGSESLIKGSAAAPGPCVAGKSESIVTEQGGGLRGAEDKCTRRCMAEH